MPLPHFLLLIVVVLVTAALTLWVGFASGVPLFALVLLGLTAALLLHLSTRDHHDQDS